MKKYCTNIECWSMCGP